MDQLLQEKLEKLYAILKNYSQVLIAFSGGTDSTFLAQVAKNVLGDKVLLVTANSATYQSSELTDAVAIAAELGLPHEVIVSEELDIPEFKDNPADRCYYCKRELFKKLRAIARSRGIEVILDGHNLSDNTDYRPGRKAAEELGVLSPLSLSGMTKPDIRKLSAEWSLSTANKPAMACLASRFPYGETITKEKLLRVETTEKALRQLGLTQFRVRSHGTLARLECIETEIADAFSKRITICEIFETAGFIYSSIDLKGYRTGAMNEVLNPKKSTPEVTK